MLLKHWVCWIESKIEFRRLVMVGMRALGSVSSTFMADFFSFSSFLLYLEME